MDTIDPAPDHSTLSRNRERLLEHDVAGEFFRVIVSKRISQRIRKRVEKIWLRPGDC